jgi:hypothetical protein
MQRLSALGPPGPTSPPPRESLGLPPLPPGPVPLLQLPTHPEGGGGQGGGLSPTGSTSSSVLVGAPLHRVCAAGFSCFLAEVSSSPLGFWRSKSRSDSVDC